MIHVRRNLCVHTTVSEGSTVLPTDKYLELFCYLPREVCYYRLAVTGVLLGVGHKLKNVIIVSGDGAGDGAGEEGD